MYVYVYISVIVVRILVVVAVVVSVVVVIIVVVVVVPTPTCLLDVSVYNALKIFIVLYQMISEQKQSRHSFNQSRGGLPLGLFLLMQTLSLCMSLCVICAFLLEICADVHTISLFVVLLLFHSLLFISPAKCLLVVVYHNRPQSAYSNWNW